VLRPVAYLPLTPPSGKDLLRKLISSTQEINDDITSRIPRLKAKSSRRNSIYQKNLRGKISTRKKFKRNGYHQQYSCRQDWIRANGIHLEAPPDTRRTGLCGNEGNIPYLSPPHPIPHQSHPLNVAIESHREGRYLLELCRILRHPRPHSGPPTPAPLLQKVPRGCFQSNPQHQGQCGLRHQITPRIPRRRAQVHRQHPPHP